VVPILVLTAGSTPFFYKLCEFGCFFPPTFLRRFYTSAEALLCCQSTISLRFLFFWRRRAVYPDPAYFSRPPLASSSAGLGGASPVRLGGHRLSGPGFSPSVLVAGFALLRRRLRIRIEKGRGRLPVVFPLADGADSCD